MTDLKKTQLFSAFDENENVKHGLPFTAYTSNDFFELEARQLFAKNWTFVGFAHDLADVGDVIPVHVAEQPLFLVRSAENQIRAFHNVCRHRNLKLVDEPQNCKTGLPARIIIGFIIWMANCAPLHFSVAVKLNFRKNSFWKIMDFMR